MALVSLDPARRLAWAEPRHGLVIFSRTRPAATLKKGCLCSAPADRPWPRARHRPSCPTRLHSRHCDPVPMAPDWRCRDAIRYCNLEALACATSHLGRYACQFLGSYYLVMANGERAWSRAHGRAGTSRREIDVLWSNSIQHKLAAILSSPDCHHRSRRSYDLSFSHRRTSGLGSLRFYRVDCVAPVMDQS